MSEKEPHIENDVLEALMDAWARYPAMRLGQLIVNVVRPENPCPEIFYIEDSQLIKKLRRASCPCPSALDSKKGGIDAEE
jgi:hypothetical protein